MIKNNRLLGLMAGISVGFAVWGTVRAESAGKADGVPVSAKEQVIAEAQRLASERSVRQEIRNSPDMIPEELKNLHAQSAVLMDADSGRILFGKNEDEIRPMASTTKIMTCILALECGDPETVCTVSSAAAAQPKVRLGAEKGTEFALRDLLYSLMLESHNDSAVMIAEAVSGSVEAFADLMNRKAEEIGCSDTHFITPNGLDASETAPGEREMTHSTTASDLARIMRYCVMQSPKREEFLKITRTMDYSFSDRNGRRYYSCTNHNALLSMLPGLISGKTGFTGGAGYSYVAAYENDGRTYILSLLGCGWPPHKTYKWSDARSMFSYGADHFQYRDILRVQPDVEIPVEGGVEDTVTARAASTEKGQQEYRLLLSEQDQVQVKSDIPAMIAAPVKKGEILGKISYFLNGELLYTDPIFAQSEAVRRNYSYCLVQIIHIFLVENENHL